MRCDDDYSFGACFLHGPYDPEATATSIALDFLVFCVLARRRQVVPASWPWPAFLKAAAKFAPFAFEKSDARLRWGSENIFAAMMGGRSLRFTAQEVYGSSADFGSDADKTHTMLLEMVESAAELNELPRALLDEVGGLEAWSAFERDMRGRGNAN